MHTSNFLKAEQNHNSMNYIQLKTFHGRIKFKLHFKHLASGHTDLVRIPQFPIIQKQIIFQNTILILIKSMLLKLKDSNQHKSENNLFNK